MDWKRRHSAIVLGWAGLAVLGQLPIGDPARFAGAVVGAVAVAAIVVFVLGSCWQYGVRAYRARRA